VKTLAIIITSYKAEQFVMEAIEAFDKQALPEDWQLSFYIGVDGCAATAKVLQANKVPYFYSSINAGTYVLTNSLLEKATNDNVDAYLRFDSDDVPCKNFLLFGLAHLNKVDFLNPTCIKCNQDLKLSKMKSKIALGPVFMTPVALKQLGGYHHYRVACDFFLTKRANLLGITTKVDHDIPTFFYRRTRTSLTKSQDTGGKSKYRKDIMHEMEQLVSAGGLKVEDPVTTSLEYIGDY